MKADSKKKPLSIEEAADLLGAERGVDVGPVRMDPISMRAIATRIAKRLASTGGRPTDASWEIKRKVPMKRSTWDELQRLSDRLAEENVRVAAGQVAAIALERGLSVLKKEGLRDCKVAKPRNCRKS